MPVHKQHHPSLFMLSVQQLSGASERASDPHVSDMALTTPNMPYCPRVHFASQLPALESIYKPFRQDEFRLLQLLGYDDYGILRCSLQHARFQDDTTLPYSAISYTWSEAGRIWYGGYDTSQKPIRTNGAVVLVSDKVGNISCLAQQVRRQPLPFPSSERSH